MSSARRVGLSQHWFAAPIARKFSTAAADCDQSAFSWHRLVSAKDMSRSNIELALEVASNIGQETRAAGKWRCDGMPARKLNLLEGRLLANLFFEPSTRTSSSFATAMVRMGGDYLNLNTATSSSKKGETLADTVRVMSQYADVLAIRHPSDSVYSDLAEEIDTAIPILNAGNGASEHPTQALLDLLCIQTELGASSLDGLQVTLVGDLKYGRTVHSLSVLLSRFDNVTLNLVAPPELRMPSTWLETIRRDNPTMRIVEVDEYHDVVDKTDVLYMTRVQQERFESAQAYEAVKGRYVLTAADLAHSKALVLHPLPRVDEISSCVDSMPNAKYFEQVGYGVVMRSALLCLALGAA